MLLYTSPDKYVSFDSNFICCSERCSWRQKYVQEAMNEWVQSNVAGFSLSLSLQVGGHCKNIPTLEYGFLVQVSDRRSNPLHISQFFKLLPFL